MCSVRAYRRNRSSTPPNRPEKNQEGTYNHLDREDVAAIELVLLERLVGRGGLFVGVPFGVNWANNQMASNNRHPMRKKKR